jgi:hypothetical protein
MSTVAILQQMEFCKEQITKYNNMYERLLTDYRVLSMVASPAPASSAPASSAPASSAPASPAPASSYIQAADELIGAIENIKESFSASASSAPKPKKSSVLERLKAREPKLDEPAVDDDDDDDEDDLIQQTLDIINNDDDVELQVYPSNSFKAEQPSNSVTSDPDIRHDALIDELESQGFLKESKLVPDKLMSDIKDGMNEEEKEFARIERRKYNARSGLEDHEAKLAKIYAREKELLAQGLSSEEVRKKVREELYPEAIPARERKGNPQIELFVEGKDGKLTRKQMNLLAWNDDDFEDDNPDLTKKIEETQGKLKDTVESRTQNSGTDDIRTQNMPEIEPPQISDSSQEKSLFDKVNELLAEDSDPADIVHEEVVRSD